MANCDIPLVEEQVLLKHRKEKKDLQAEIQKLKKGVSKGDKKRKKEVNEEIAKMESDLNLQQEKELAEFKTLAVASPKEADNSDKTVDEDNGTSGLKPAQETEEYHDEAEDIENDAVDQATGQKKSKAQKRRDKKANQGKERDQRIQAQEVEKRQGPRQVEILAVARMLKERGLSLHDIPADGNCMYNAVAHQMSLRNQQMSCEELREKTADYMRQHPDDFIPFLVHPSSDSIMTPEQFSEYCDKTEKKPVWGGQLELRALSEVLNVPIQVLQANVVKPVLIGECKTQQPPISLVYHLHAYRLGEHYNSVKPRPTDDETTRGEEDGDL